MLTLAAAMMILHVTLDARSTVADLPVTAILDEVRELWKPYLEVVFRTEAEPDTGCAGTVRLLLTDQATGETASGSHAALGWIEFVGHEQPSPTITVSLRTAQQMQQQGRWLGRPLGALPLGSRETFLTRALSRAIAHEIGHYVLRSTAHSSAGLMRPHFTIADIMDGRRSHFRLGREEETRLAVLAAAEPTRQAAIASPNQWLAARVDDFKAGTLCQTHS